LFWLCLSSSYVPIVASFSGLSIFILSHYSLTCSWAFRHFHHFSFTYDYWRDVYVYTIQFHTSHIFDYIYNGFAIYFRNNVKQS
jgi:hypothetical protein